MVLFIRAISDTSPTSKLNVTFLRTSAIEDAGHSRGQRTAAYNSRNVVICAMLVGSVPVRRFSPSSLPGYHQGQAEVPQTDRPSVGDVQIGDGWHRENKGGEPARQRIPCDVSAAQPKHIAQRCVRKGCASSTQPWQRNRTWYPVVVELDTHGSTLPLGGCGGDHLGTACGS